MVRPRHPGHPGLGALPQVSFDSSPWESVLPLHCPGLSCSRAFRSFCEGVRYSAPVSDMPLPPMLRSRAKELKPRRQDSGLRSGVGSTGSPRCLRVYVLRAYRFGLGNGKGFWLPDASLSGLREQWLRHHLAL